MTKESKCERSMFDTSTRPDGGPLHRQREARLMRSKGSIRRTDAVARSRDHCDPSSAGPASRLGTQLETSRLSMGYIGYRMSVPRALVLLCLSTLPSFGATFGTVVAHAQPLAD